MEENNSRKVIIKLTESGRQYLLLNDGSIEDESTNRILDKEFDKELIDKIMDRFKHSFSDDM